MTWIDLTIFGIGMLTANIVFFVNLQGANNTQTINYVKNFKDILISYLPVLSLKFISTMVGISNRIKIDGILWQKILGSLCYLLFSPITFSLIFIFFLGIQFTVYVTLSTPRLNQDAYVKNTIFVAMSLLGIYSVNQLNDYLSETASMRKNETVKIVFTNALPLQSINPNA